MQPIDGLTPKIPNDDGLTPMIQEERVKDFDNYEVNTYMQKDIKPIHMPRMQNFKRAENNDPGQSSSRADMEATLIKNLIVSYYDTVRK